ncbi:hypothetical protein EDB84DRAFT_1597662 [Lactarius hengduanensis]|nr:hypothetical protein EDB84DRAFT_1597662 [Lactarius hengduanensis]
MSTSPVVPSPLPAAASTLKRVDDISITADEDDADDGPSFAPCTPAPPPRNPRRPFSPRLASPIASILDSVKPVDEQPPPPRSVCRSASPIVPVTTRDESSDPPLPLIETPDLSPTASAAQRAEDRPIATPIEADHGETPVTSPHASNGTARKRKHKTDEEDDTHPGKRIHAQLARRRIPLPQKYRYVQRHSTISPPPVDDSSGLFTPIRLCPSSPSDRLTTPHHAVSRDVTPLQLPSQSSPATDLTANVERHPANLAFVTPVSHPRLPPHSVSPSPPTEINAISLPSPPAIRDISPSDIRTPPPIALLDLITVDRPPPSLPAFVDGAANDIRFAPPSPSPFLALLPAAISSLQSPPLPHTSLVEDDNIPKRGVKTIETSVLTSNIVSLTSPTRYYPHIFPPRAYERPRDPDKITPTTPQHKSQNSRASAAGTTSHPPNSRATHKREGHTDTTRHTNGTEAFQEPAQHERYQPYPLLTQPPSRPPRDLDKPTAKYPHVQQAHARRAPRPVDSRISNEQPPDALAKRRAVDEFLNTYDAARTVQKPTPAKDDRAYDAITQHLDSWLWRDPERCYLSYPFHLHHIVVPHATIGPQQSKNTKTEDAEPPQRSKQSRSHSPGHIRKTRIRHALTREERRRISDGRPRLQVKSFEDE